MDTVTLIGSALRGLLAVAGQVLGAALRAVVASGGDYASAAKPQIDWDDPGRPRAAGRRPRQGRGFVPWGAGWPPA
jgi:hypothetical protein